MKPFKPLIAILTTTSSPVAAHWAYNRLIVNDAYVGEPYQYIRKPTSGNNFLSDVNSTDMRCNVGGASGVALNTQTATVHAGDTLGFGIDETFGHPGIQQVYLSRAPDLPSSSQSTNSSSSSAAALYDGSGGWARIYALTTTPTYPNGTGTTGKNSFAEAQPGAVDWATHKLESFLFTLPPETPVGEYLLRAEGMAVHAAHKPGGAQFYVSCAQIRVEDAAPRQRRNGDVSNRRNGYNGNDKVAPDSGIVGPLVSIPGAYRGDEPGVLLPQFWSALTRYTTPGPALWPPGTKEVHVGEHL
ncbi:glycosyl hydrolase family 61-domain-containing protein [Xylaria arbuscula]|nr:glycosyl hydrolase family 61-domain-containing protein [Xylaria arbuscula]